MCVCVLSFLFRATTTQAAAPRIRDRRHATNASNSSMPRNATPSRKSTSPARGPSPSPGAGRSRRASTITATRASANLAATPSNKKVVTPKTAPRAKKASNDAAFYASLRIYAACVSTLTAVLILLYLMRPPPPETGSCDGVSPYMLLKPSTDGLVKVWTCTKAYQEANWWFVLASFEVAYVGLKMLAIPAAFSLCLLSGALFPFPLCTLLTGFGEALGSSLCYLLSQAFLGPIIERFFADKLLMLQKKADENRQFMLSFNFFLRLTPFLPNWFINLACPLVGVPLVPFFWGSLLGTQLSLSFLALSGATLKTAGEKGFDLDEIKGNLLIMGLLMAVLQCVPLTFIYLTKRQQGATSKKKN